MSKRFGRNQKRRLRAEINALTEQVELVERRLADEQRRGQENAWAVADTIEVLGRYCATVPVPNIETDHIESLFTPYRVPMMQRLPQHVNGAPKLMDAMNIIELHPILLEQVQDYIGAHAKINVRQTGKVVAAYGLSENARLNIPRDILARKIGKELGDLIANQEVLS